MIIIPRRLIFRAVLAGISLLTYVHFSDAAVRPAAAGAQPTMQESQLEEEIANVYRRSGDQIPMYVVVDHFFDVMSIKRKAGPKNWNRMLNRLTISPGSQAEEALDRATSEARSIMDTTTNLAPYQDDPVAFVEVQLKAIRRKVHALSRVFLGMCDELEQDGISLEHLEEVS